MSCCCCRHPPQIRSQTRSQIRYQTALLRRPRPGLHAWLEKNGQMREDEAPFARRPTKSTTIKKTYLAR